MERRHIVIGENDLRTAREPITVPWWRWNRRSHLVTRNAGVVYLQLWTADNTRSFGFWLLRRANIPHC